MKRKIVVTGGTSGMGFEIAKLFAQNGDDVVITGIEKNNDGNEIANDLSNIYSKSNILYLKCNVSDEKSVVELVEFVDKSIGGCDVLINNAGIFEGGQLHETSIESWNKVFDVDVKGIFLMSKYFLPQMLTRKKGIIINISSVSGLFGDANMAAYTAAKGAVTNLTRAMALDYASKGIRVNAICPTATSTPMFLKGSTKEVIDSFNNSIPMGRVAQPIEIAEAVFFLSSEKASFITGINLPVDGGLTSHTGQPIQNK